MKFLRTFFKSKPEQTYIILSNGCELELQWAIDRAMELRNYKWILDKWEARPAIIDKSGGTIHEFAGQKYDKNSFNLNKGGWKHDHCEICHVMITIGELGYRHQTLWICPECHANFIKPRDLGAAIDKMTKIEK